MPLPYPLLRGGLTNHRKRSHQGREIRAKRWQVGCHRVQIRLERAA